MYFDTVKFNETTFYILANNNGLVWIGTDESVVLKHNAEKHVENMREYTNWLTQYFVGKIPEMTLMRDDRIGTVFQKRVWNTLESIPYGQTVSYQEIASILGMQKGYRVVAAAIAKNPFLIVVPCHRVIGKNNHLTGYREGLALKRSFLSLEGVKDLKN